jgi:hypothetical protein
MTSWFSSSNITQHAEYEKNIEWRLSKPIQSSRDILYISNDGHAPLREKTWFIHFTDFRFQDLPETISGVELRTNIRRKGRILDETVMLRYDDMVIGENKIAYNLDEMNHIPVNNTTYYGNPTDLWTANLTKAMLEDPSFGVTLRLQSHLFYPHRETAIIDSVELRVY